jgi:hypothetical protein
MKEAWVFCWTDTSIKSLIIRTEDRARARAHTHTETHTFCISAGGVGISINQRAVNSSSYSFVLGSI